MTPGFALVVRFTLRDEEAATAFDRLTEQTIQQISANEPGTLTYVSHIPDGEPLVRVFYELYAGRAAFDAHEAQSHTRYFLQHREQYLTNVDVTFMTETSGKRPTGEAR
ncbi:antibiotic biosynthesis monooxygenase [Kitasatospora sp. GP82]|uniref:putative quinol monooxygenase n=1 Tax=Kitasatospora sp. GP82 TaxID=3035089 RepID=UPI00247430BE|nr:antibiotic biosynthesis monooxygenase [Kitasatospora sp. GP82]MDH6125951.1 quinol monooxygenase YgiN [Kitasatospora sp. GP82]